MTHLMLTSALLFALLAVVAIAIGASLGIAHDLVLDDARETTVDTQSAPAGYAAGPGYAARQSYAAREGYVSREGHAAAGAPREAHGHGLAEDFGLGLQHATHFSQDPGRSFSRSRSFSARV